ncbi:hypothetical protein M407DRAFT_33021 [Tulasnella calospora MUT 4182]|uniref:Uncharacterized protein n=1 Tax=Tulasnella calospora MUT 4182 TaxID=1051891 RepID=A0A0C3Q3R6_9AGAM|nr:hypothetical protein M407DRAFT_33021 [Tulasnella calospora MUT 4182]
MAPIRSEAAAAAAPAITRAGRVKRASQAALCAVSSEKHEAQQAHRSCVGACNTGMNSQGQAVVAGTPKVSISTSAAKHSARHRPLVPIENTVHDRLSNHRTSHALPQYSASQPLSAPGRTRMLITTSQSRLSQGQQEERSEEEDMENAEVGGEEVVSRIRGWPDDEEERSDVDVLSEVGDVVDEEAGGTDRDKHAMGVDAIADEDEDDVGADGLEGDGVERPKKHAPWNTKKGKKSQPKAADYDEDTEELLNHSLGYMRSIVISENPMLSVNKSINLAGDVTICGR